ncbi:MAG: patatin-like phospholipase family protein [Actinobacteria bacterium]|nr:MAG: patatin-like phospholipase family protein [Actinomycetota bacterium]
MVSRRRNAKKKVAFVLGGGGHLGAHEVGMLQALLEHDIRPELVLGTSIGALNGAAVAAEPSMAMVERLATAWKTLTRDDVFGGSFLYGAARLVRGRAHLHSNEGLRRLITRTLPVQTFEELAVPFQCVAASVERAAEHWFTSGPLVDAILASSAVPGILPVVRLDGEHFMDGGIVNSIPIERAVHLGATDIYVLHVGRIDRPLGPPKNLWQVAMITFEIARRHRFAHDLVGLPKETAIHVLPTGDDEPIRYDSLAQLRYRDFSAVSARIERAHRATDRYLRNEE